MSEPSKVGGMWESAKGATKEAVGNLFGNERLEAEGRAQNVAGKGEQQAANIQNTASGTYNEDVGATKATVGSATGDRSQQISGEAQRAKGKFQQNI